jgi:hypothetical protein
VSPRPQRGAPGSATDRLRDVADDIVSHLTAADLALTAGDLEASRAAVAQALGGARELAAALLTADVGHRPGPGELVRPRPPE